MIKLKEFESKYHSGFYVDSHVDKELFLKVLLKHSKVLNYLNEWQEEVRPTITVDCIEHCWMSENSNPTVKFDYEIVPLSMSVVGKPVTFYEFWWIV